MPENIKKIGLGLLGLGTVGTGVVQLLEKNRKSIENKAGTEIFVVGAAVRDKSKTREGIPADLKITEDAEEIINDPNVDIVVELMGGFEPARTHIIKAMEKGKHIVTANKAVMATHWDEIFQTARKHEVDVYLEAAVGGGIPCIQTLNDGLAANEIQEIMAIINGTTNYILTEMQTGSDFKSALKEAQKKGYAEADPSFDIDGMDACHKLAILASIAFGRKVRIDEIRIQGIRGLTREDLDAAREELFCKIKHLAIAKAHENNTLEVLVAPVLLPLEHSLSNVDDVYNAVQIRGDAAGKIVNVGRGAGKMPTASAVMSDIIFISRNITKKVAGRVPSVAYNPGSTNSRRILSTAEIKNRFFLRFTAKDQPGVLAVISSILGKHRISISSVHQRERKKGVEVPVYIATYRAFEQEIYDAITEIEKHPMVKNGTLVMRLELPEE
jgi:homoserine dehydrogenase